MPTYEYECKSCSHSFEVFQSMNDPPLTDCPECGREVRRLIFGGTGVIFKGSGFYVTDKGKGGKAETKPVSSKQAESGAKSADSASKQSLAGGDTQKNPSETAKAKPESKSA